MSHSRVPYRTQVSQFRPIRVSHKSVSLGHSLRHAWRGLAYAWRAEANVRRHLLITFIVLVVAVWLKISLLYVVLLGLVSFLIVSLEMVNSAIEALADAIHPAHHPLIQQAKDIAAGAVLLMSLAAVAIGVAILGVPLHAWLVGWY